MDNCYFWDDNHFNILFDDSTPPHVEPILESKQEPFLHILLHFYYFIVEMNDFLVGSTSSIHMTIVNIWRIIFSELWCSDIFNVEFT
jgi:hypothetical protein